MLACVKQFPIAFKARQFSSLTVTFRRVLN